MIEVSNQYDALGIPRPMEKPVNSLSGVFITDTEDRRKGKSDKELYVLRKLELMAIATDSSIEMPRRIPAFGNTDLSATPISVFFERINGGPLNEAQAEYIKKHEGKTLYDRLNEIYRGGEGEESPDLTEILYGIFSNEQGLYGTASKDGAITQVVKAQIQKQRNIAAILLLEELGDLNSLGTRAVRRGEAKAGLRDDIIFPNVRN